jgi:hypothetical protein
MFCVTIETAMVALYGEAGTNKSGLATGAAMLFLFQACYATCGDVCVFVIVSEIFPNHIRAKGSIVAYTANALTNLVYLQVAPTAFANIHWKFFLVGSRTTTPSLRSSKSNSSLLGLHLNHRLRSCVDLLLRSRDQGHRFGGIG